MSAASPFVAGYTTAIRAELGVGNEVQLAPEALEAILKDCAAFRRQYVLPWYDGAEFWGERQSGHYSPFFPPLTVSLGDDGRIHLSEARS